MISKLLKKNEKGFTLMEMLIVVAIIAVLVAIAIPTFTSSLNKAKLAADEANVRAGYASVMVRILQDDVDNAATPSIAKDTVYYLLKDGTVDTGSAKVTDTTAYACQYSGKQSAAGQEYDTTTNKYVTYTYDGTKVTIGTAALPTA